VLCKIMVSGPLLFSEQLARWYQQYHCYHVLNRLAPFENPPFAAWESFYVIVGSPGAALTGAISLHPLQTRSGSPTSPTNGRAKAAYRMKRRLADGRDVTPRCSRTSTCTFSTPCGSASPLCQR